MTTKPTLGWALAAGLLLAAGLACNFGQRPRAAEPAPTRAASSGGGATIAVSLDEFSIDLEPAPSGAGEVTFVVTNTGRAEHDFRVRGEGLSEKTAMLGAGESDSLTLKLEPGTYEYFCTVGGHDQLGMEGTFKVD